MVKTSKSLKLRWGVGDWKTTSWYISSYFIGIGGRGYLFIMIIKSHFDTDKLFETTEGAWIEDLCHPQSFLKVFCCGVFSLPVSLLVVHLSIRMCTVIGDKLFFKTAPVEIVYKLRGTEYKLDRVASNVFLYVHYTSL